MVMPMRPFTRICEACGCSRTVVPVSDVLSPKDFPDICPGCGGTQFEMRRATPWEVAVAKCKRLLKHP